MTDDTPAFHEHVWRNRVSGGSLCEICELWRDERVYPPGRSPADIDRLVEYPDVYDGYSVTVWMDGTWENRWADRTDPSKPAAGYERRYAATQAHIDEETTP